MTSAMNERIALTMRDGVADVRLNRPEKMNALDPLMFTALLELGETLAHDSTVRAVVVSGAGRAFCAGVCACLRRTETDSRRPIVVPINQRNSMTFDTIKLDISNDIAVLTLNQPDSRNGLTERLQKEMLTALEQVSQQDDVRALILTGVGKAFCSGADLGQLDTTADSGASLGDSVAKMMEEIANPLILALQNLPMPVVSAVNGSAAGAGISLALAADIVIAGRSAFFLTPFLPRLGIVPDMGATWFLSQQLGRARALGLILLGDRLPAEKAAQWGLIWACVEDANLLEEAMNIAIRLAKAPSHSAQEARRALDAAASQGLAAQLDYEKERQRVLLDLPSFKEGVQAFFEKREPVFRR